MAEQQAQAKPADTRMEGATNDAAIKGTNLAIETIQAFAREIAEMSWRAVVRTDRHIEKLRTADSLEVALAIQADFLKESMERAVQHTRKYIEMLATFPPELVQPVNAAVEAARQHATPVKVGRPSDVSHKA